MSLYQKFFEEGLHLFPSQNEMFNILKYSHLNSQLENSFDEHHIILWDPILSMRLTCSGLCWY